MGCSGDRPSSHPLGSNTSEGQEALPCYRVPAPSPQTTPLLAPWGVLVKEGPVKSEPAGSRPAAGDGEAGNGDNG